MAMYDEVREILFKQMDALHKRSMEHGIPLIALDSLSGKIAAIGEILLNDDEEVFTELSLLRDTVRQGRGKVKEINDLLKRESDCTDRDILGLLDKLRMLLDLQGEEG